MWVRHGRTKGRDRKEKVGDQHPPPRMETSKRGKRGWINTRPEPHDGKGEEGEFSGYTLTTEDLQLKEVYRDWVHVNVSDHLHKGNCGRRGVSGVVVRSQNHAIPHIRRFEWEVWAPFCQGFEHQSEWGAGHMVADLEDDRRLGH